MAPQKIISRKEAKAMRLKTYFTGKPCKSGHISERGIHLGCLECRKIINKKFQNKEDRKNYIKEYQEKYKETEKGKEVIKKAQKKFRNKVTRKNYIKEYQEKYKETEKGKESIKRKQKKYNSKKNSSPQGKLEMNIRRYILETLKKEKLKKEDKLVNLIGCSLIELKEHIENQFQDGMSWSNWGKASKIKKSWHIDHIVPINYFRKNYDFNDKRVQKICWHFENLQPMWASDNISKSNKVDEEYAEDLIEYIQLKMSKNKGNKMPKDYDPYKDTYLMEFVEAFKKSGLTTEDLKDGTFEIEKEKEGILKLKGKKVN